MLRVAELGDGDSASGELSFPTRSESEKPEIKRQAILDEICVRPVQRFRDRTTTTTTIDNPLFVKPFNVSRFIDGQRRRDRMHTDRLFANLYFDRQPAQ